VFFALTTATVGELAPVMSGVELPQSRVGAAAHQQLTLGVSNTRVSLGERVVMGTAQAASARSNDPAQPLLIPKLYDDLKKAADSIRKETKTPAGQSIDVPLAIQGDKAMRYDLMSRMIQTARVAGFRRLSLQVSRTEGTE
jgi:hypothetical protein